MSADDALQLRLELCDFTQKGNAQDVLQMVFLRVRAVKYFIDIFFLSFGTDSLLTYRTSSYY